MQSFKTLKDCIHCWLYEYKTSTTGHLGGGGGGGLWGGYSGLEVCRRQYFSNRQMVEVIFFVCREGGYQGSLNG